jgi:hypothetical protein
MTAALPTLHHGREHLRAASAVPMLAEPFRLNLWVPTTALFLLLAPLPILAMPLLYLAPRRVLPDPIGLVLGVGRLLSSLGGTTIEVEAPEARIRIRLF